MAEDDCCLTAGRWVVPARFQLDAVARLERGHAKVMTNQAAAATRITRAVIAEAMRRYRVCKQAERNGPETWSSWGLGARSRSSNLSRLRPAEETCTT